MSSPTSILTATASAEEQLQAGVERKGQRLFELCLVLCVAFGNSLFNAVNGLIYGASGIVRVGNSRWVFGILEETISLLLLGYVLRRSGRKFRDIGLHWSIRDVGWGALISAASYVAYHAAAVSIWWLHFSILGTRPTAHSPKEFFGFSVLAIPFSLLNPFFEELIVRAYVITEIKALTGSAALGVFASVAIQFAYHLYYGWWIALSMAFSFLVLSLYFARWQRALPLVVAHGIADLTGLIHL